MLLTEMFDELGQAPGGKRPPGVLRRGPGDPADQLADVEAEPTGSAPAPFWVQRREPLGVERVDHLAPQPDSIARRPGDLHQSLRLTRIQLPDEHVRPAVPSPTSGNRLSADQRGPITTPTFLDEALAIGLRGTGRRITT